MSRRSNIANGVEKEVKDVTKEPPQDKQKRLLETPNPGHFSMIRALHLADLITLGNGFCGLMSIFSSLRYTLSPPTDFSNLCLALGFIPLGLFFDFMDGKVARWRHKSSLMGQELDSLADLVSFGVSPAVAAFAIGMRTPVDHLLLTFFALCGLLRLARFNVTAGSVPHDESGKAKYFEGTPIPMSLGMVSLMGFLVSKGWILADIPLGVFGEGQFWEFHPLVLIFVLHGCTMVSKTLHVPKP